MDSVTDPTPYVRRTVTTEIEVVDPRDPNTVRVRDVYWRLWVSKGGSHYATRAGRLTEEQTEAGCEMTLAADTPEGLRALLVNQPDVPQGTED